MKSSTHLNQIPGQSLKTTTKINDTPAYIFMAGVILLTLLFFTTCLQWAFPIQ